MNRLSECMAKIRDYLDMSDSDDSCSCKKGKESPVPTSKSEAKSVSVKKAPKPPKTKKGAVSGGLVAGGQSGVLRNWAALFSD